MQPAKTDSTQKPFDVGQAALHSGCSKPPHAPTCGTSHR